MRIIMVLGLLGLSRFGCKVRILGLFGLLGVIRGTGFRRVIWVNRIIRGTGFRRVIRVNRVIRRLWLLQCSIRREILE
jgi:hypothetical protein